MLELSGAARHYLMASFVFWSVPNTKQYLFSNFKKNSTLSATGVITCSLPPLGWERTYSAHKKRYYRADNGLDPMFLRVDDSCSAGAPATGAKFAKITSLRCNVLDIDNSLMVLQMPFDSI